MKTVRLRDRQDDLVLVDAMRASAATRAAALPRAEASLRLHACSGLLDAETLAELYDLAFGHTLAPPRTAPARDVILRRVVEAAESGRLLVAVLRGIDRRPDRAGPPSDGTRR